MATLNIAEFISVAQVSSATWSGGSAQAPKTPPVAPPVDLPISGSIQTHAVAKAARFARLSCDAACYVQFTEDGSTPTPGPGDMPMYANQTEYFGVGATTKIGVVQKV